MSGKTRKAYLARLEQNRLATLEQRGRVRREAFEIAAGVAETVNLSTARGAAFETAQCRPGEREAAYRRQVGLEWLLKKGRISAHQKSVGERYGACYRRVAGEPAIPSSLDVKPGDNGGASLPTVLARAEARAQAARKLDEYRRRLGGQETLVAACDLICGKELTPREASACERAAGKLEAVLAVALDLLASELEPGDLLPAATLREMKWNDDARQRDSRAPEADQQAHRQP